VPVCGKWAGPARHRSRGERAAIDLPLFSGGRREGRGVGNLRRTPANGGAGMTGVSVKGSEAAPAGKWIGYPNLRKRPPAPAKGPWTATARDCPRIHCGSQLTRCPRLRLTTGASHVVAGISRSVTAIPSFGRLTGCWIGGPAGHSRGGGNEGQFKGKHKGIYSTYLTPHRLSHPSRDVREFVRS
jgi:hypothetical protein